MTMRKKKVKPGLNDALRAAVQEEMANLISDDDPNEPLVPEAQTFEKQTPQITKILSMFPSSEGYYGKLYRKLPSGKLEFVYHIDILEDIDDPEVYISDILHEKKWKGGDYVLRVYLHGSAGCQKTIPFSINFDEGLSEQIPSSLGLGQSPQDSLVNHIQSTKEIVSMVKEFMGEKSEPIPIIQQDPNLIAKNLAESFKSGIDVVRDSMPKPQDPIQFIQALKTLGMIKEDKPEPAPIQPVSQSQSFMEMLSLMKELGFIGQKPEPKQDIWTEILKLKELGLIKMSGDDNIMDTIDRIKPLIELFGNMGGGSGEKTSILTELIRVVGPKIPEIIGHVTGAVRDITEVTKLKMMGQIQRPATMPTAPYSSSLSSSIPTNQPPSTLGTESTTVPIPSDQSSIQSEQPMLLLDIKSAIEKQDHDFFPKLEEIINLTYGPHAMETLVYGQVSVDTILESLPGWVISNKEMAKNYFNAFIAWKKKTVEDNKVVAHCESCNEVYEYPSVEEFEKDSKSCEVCEGKIVFIPKSIEAEKTETETETENVNPS